MTDPTQSNMTTPPMSTSTPSMETPTSTPPSPSEVLGGSETTTPPAPKMPADPFNLSGKTGAKPAMPATPTEPGVQPEPMEGMPEVKLPNAMSPQAEQTTAPADPMAPSSMPQQSE